MGLWERQVRRGEQASVMAVKQRRQNYHAVSRMYKSKFWGKHDGLNDLQTPVGKCRG
jgi:hypothetical protein